MGACCCSCSKEPPGPRSLQSQFQKIYGDSAEPFLDSCITPDRSDVEKARKAQRIQEIASSATVSDLSPPTYFADSLLHVTRSLKIDFSYGANKNDPLLYLMKKYKNGGDATENNNTSFGSVASTASSSSSSSNGSPSSSSQSSSPSGSEPTFFQDYHKLVEIPMTDPLFDVISRVMMETRFENSTRNYKIKSVKRIENSRLWARFALARHKMEQLIALGVHPACQKISLPPRSASSIEMLQQPRRSPIILSDDDDDFAAPPISVQENVQQKVTSGRSVLSYGEYFRDNFQLHTSTVNEVMLFHGTKPHAVESICKGGLDCVKFSVASGCFGASNYFAENSQKSEAYCATTSTSDSCFMFLCRVLIGEYYEAHHTTYPFTFRAPCVHGHVSDHARRNHAKMSTEKLRNFPSCSAHRQADSVIGNNPREFVVYENDRVYPEYLIEFTRS